MHGSRSVLAVAIIGVLVAACGGSGATQAPGGATTNPGGGAGTPTTTPGGGATTNPGGGGAPTTPGGGGGGGGGTGTIHLVRGGAAPPTTVDLPFFSIGSRFGGDAGGALNFTGEGATGVASVGSAGDVWTISYISETLTANATECNRTGWNIGATNASGTFDCKNGFAIKVDGTYLTGVTMKGNFTASH